MWHTYLFDCDSRPPVFLFIKQWQTDGARWINIWMKQWRLKLAWDKLKTSTKISQRTMTRSTDSKPLTTRGTLYGITHDLAIPSLDLQNQQHSALMWTHCYNWTGHHKGSINSRAISALQGQRHPNLTNSQFYTASTPCVCTSFRNEYFIVISVFSV